MKATFVVLALACAIGAIHAFPLQEEEVESSFGIEPQIFPQVEEEEIEPEIFPNFEDQEEVEPEVFPNFEDQEEEVEPEVFPIFEEEETDAVRPTSVRPVPPRPTTRRPRPPQIHDNISRSQMPMSGRLTNVVLNRSGDQKTLQRNRIEYNINAVRQALEELLEEENSE